jgi:hypothetical protein
VHESHLVRRRDPTDKKLQKNVKTKRITRLATNVGLVVVGLCLRHSKLRGYVLPTLPKISDEYNKRQHDPDLQSTSYNK